MPNENDGGEISLNSHSMDDLAAGFPRSPAPQTKSLGCSRVRTLRILRPNLLSMRLLISVHKFPYFNA